MEESDKEHDNLLHHSRLWGYDPLFENKYKLSIRDILNLEIYDDYRGVFCVSNHPVISVWIMGDVVSVLIKEKYTSFRGQGWYSYTSLNTS